MNFIEICDTFKYNRVSDDVIHLRWFPFSLRDKAKGLVNALSLGSITTYDKIAQKFHAKFFLLAKTAKLRMILPYLCNLTINLYMSWECYKELTQKCPYHGFLNGSWFKPSTMV